MTKQKENTQTPAVKADTSLAISAEAAASNWGAIEEMDTTDLLVPKIFHQQALSKFATEGTAKAGDFCDSLTGQVLATKDKPLEIIIFGSFKTVVVSRFDAYKNKYEYDKTITLTPENALEWASRPFQEVTDTGEQYQNSLQYNFYCLLPSLIKELPFVLTLGSTKTRAAKKLNTMLFKLSQLKRPGASVVFELKSVAEKNDKGAWFGLEVTQGRNATPEELMRAHAWYVKSKSQKFVVAEEETVAAEDAPVGQSSEESVPF